MRLQVGGVDHHGAGGLTSGGERLENMVKCADLAPAEEPVVRRLLRTMAARRIATKIEITLMGPEPRTRTVNGTRAFFRRAH